ncbi:MAG: alpha/beta fold hydrolase [Xanthomonadaceae bacterium]|nr:alpha/beta fold hydrolase [Xanthomonadaceae bacterium]
MTAEPAGPREQTIDLPGLRLAARTWGDPALPPLLALHGWLDNAGSFDRLAPRLATTRQVIALDLPGHGRSGHLPAGAHYHFVDSVGTLLAAANALGLARFDLLGHSLGGAVASLVAVAAPERVDRLALIEALGPLADDGRRTLEHFRNAYVARAGAADKRLRVFADLDAAIMARVAAGGLDAEAARPIVERGVRAVADGLVWSSDPRLTLPSPVHLAESQVRALLAGLRTPTLLLLAVPETPYLPAALIAARAAGVADLRIRHLDGGHHLQLDRPDAVADAVRAHLDRPDSGAPA